MTIIFVLLIVSVNSQALAIEPAELIKNTSEELLDKFTANREHYEADHSSLYDMVRRVAIPHFDFERMTKIVLGRHFEGATQEQRKQFSEEFQTLLLRTYSQALFQYSNEKIEYKPAVPYRNGVIVKAEIDVGAAVPVRLEYFLGKKEGEWKVYDVRIDGISLVTTFRNSYNATIKRQGLPLLIADLQKKNRIK